mmetsp:Transcript_127101/g.189553  ORF Transcript_127101/g.189553 Transcript_127101/m.189553 type:complete len:226 (+) Transcript_127101:3-680(+)
MSAPKFHWRIRSNFVEDGKIFDTESGEFPLTIGKDVGEIATFGAKLNKKSMSCGLTLPPEIKTFFGVNPFTISIWFKTTSTKGNSTVFGNRSAGSHGKFFCIRYAAKHISAEFDDDGRTYAPMRCDRELNDGQWHQVIVIRDGVTHQLIIDKELSCSIDTASPIDLNKNTHDDYRLGVCPISNVYNLYFEGCIGDVAIYDRALTLNQVAEIAVFPSLSRAKSAAK